MIVNTGGRTDTVRFYSDWLLRRFEEGYALSRNPLFPNKVSRIDLDPEVVDCVMFCSKDYAPILSSLREITDRFNTYFHYTITAYGTDVEPGVPPVEEAIDTLKRLSAQVGKGRVAWRYDPVLLTEAYTVEHHLETFEAMAANLWHERRLFQLRHPSVGLYDARGHRRGQRREVPQPQAQGHARGLPLHREPRSRCLRHLPQRVQILLRQQAPRHRGEEPSVARSRLPASARALARHGHPHAGLAEELPREGLASEGLLAIGPAGRRRTIGRRPRRRAPRARRRTWSSATL